MAKRLILFFILFQLICYNVYALDENAVLTMFYQFFCLFLLLVQQLLLNTPRNRRVPGGWYISYVVECCFFVCFLLYSLKEISITCT